MQKCFLLTLVIIFITPKAFSASIFADPMRSENKLPQRNESCQIDDNIKKIDLVNAIDIALCNNPEIKSSWFNAKAGAANLGKSRSEYLPKIDASINQKKTNIVNNVSFVADADYSTRVATATLNWMLYDFGGRSARIESAKQQMLAAGYSYNSNMQNIIFNVIENYANVLIAKESLEAAIKNQESAQKIYEAAKARLNVGSVTKADEAQSKTLYSEAKLALQNAQNNLQIALGNFAILLNFPPNKELQLEKIDFENFNQKVKENIEDLIARALEKRPDLAAAKAREKQAEAELRRAKSTNYPTISGTATSSKTYYENMPLHNRVDSSFGIGLSVPIFTGFDNHYQIRGARESLRSATENRIQNENAASLDVWTSYNNYQTAKLSFQTSKDILNSAELSEELTIGRYKSGKGSLIDAINAQAKSASARYTFVQAKNNLLVTKFDLNRSLGDIEITN